MSIETATQRLREANPVRETDLLRSESDDLTALLHATWQRSTNVQTQEPQKLTPVKAPEKNPQPRGWLIALAVAAVTIIVIGAVALLPLTQGSDDAVDTPPTTLDAAPTPTTSVAVQAGPTTFEIETFDYGFRGLPAEFIAGDIIELVNSSATEYHNLVVIRLEADDTRTVEDFAALPREAFEVADQPNTVEGVGILHAAPGEAAFDGRIRMQVPGRYLLIDMVPQGADAAKVEENVNPSDPSFSPSPPWNIAGGPLGYQHGMIAIVTVVAP